MPKDTDTVQRFKIHYHDPDAPEAGTGFPKVETSFRDVSPDAEVVEARGIRTYAIPTIFEQKPGAFANRDAPRDLFDLAHMAERYGDQLGPDQLARAEAATRDLGGIAGRFGSAFERDPVLRHLVHGRGRDPAPARGRGARDGGPAGEGADGEPGARGGRRVRAVGGADRRQTVPSASRPAPGGVSEPPNRSMWHARTVPSCSEDRLRLAEKPPFPRRLTM